MGRRWSRCPAVHRPPSSNRCKQERREAKQQERERIGACAIDQLTGGSFDALVGVRREKARGVGSNTRVVALDERIDKGVELGAAWKVGCKRRARIGPHRVGSHSPYARHTHNRSLRFCRAKPSARIRQVESVRLAEARPRRGASGRSEWPCGCALPVCVSPAPPAPFASARRLVPSKTAVRPHRKPENRWLGRAARPAISAARTAGCSIARGAVALRLHRTRRWRP